MKESGTGLCNLCWHTCAPETPAEGPPSHVWSRALGCRAKPHVATPKRTYITLSPRQRIRKVNARHLISSCSAVVFCLILVLSMSSGFHCSNNSCTALCPLPSHNEWVPGPCGVFLQNMVRGFPCRLVQVVTRLSQLAKTDYSDFITVPLFWETPA